MLQVLEVRFMHHSISSRFRPRNEEVEGRRVDDIIDDILKRKLSPQEFPPLELVRHPDDGLIYSISNRRLFVFRVLYVKGKVQTLPGKLFSFGALRKSGVGAVGDALEYVQWRRAPPTHNCSHEFH